MTVIPLQNKIVHAVTGETVSFIETAEQTAGAYLLIEVSLSGNKSGPPLHIHDEFEEEFECVSGKLTVTLAKQKRVLLPGEKALVHKLVPHTFTNEHEQPVTFRVRLTPPSRFEESIRIHYGLMDDGLANKKGNPKSIFHTALVLTLQNTWIAGLPIGLQRRLFGYLVKRGARKGVYENFSKYTGKKFHL